VLHNMVESWKYLARADIVNCNISHAEIFICGDNKIMQAQCHSEFVTWEQAKVMGMFLRCLRFSLAGH
jgi:hypothetical protein